MITGQRVVCIRSDWEIVKGGDTGCYKPCAGDTVTINRVEKYNGFTILCFKECNPRDAFDAANFIPLDENWTEEVIANVLKKQLTEPVNNGLHFSQIIG